MPSRLSGEVLIAEKLISQTSGLDSPLCNTVYLLMDFTNSTAMASVPIVDYDWPNPWIYFFLYRSGFIYLFLSDRLFTFLLLSTDTNAANSTNETEIRHSLSILLPSGHLEASQIVEYYTLSPQFWCLRQFWYRSSNAHLQMSYKSIPESQTGRWMCQGAFLFSPIYSQEQIDPFIIALYLYEHNHSHWARQRKGVQRSDFLQNDSVYLDLMVVFKSCSFLCRN